MSNFKGYYMKINNCTFNDPPMSREGFKVSPKLVQVTDAGRVASGKLIIKELPHKPAKLEIQFPVMTEEQFRKYYGIISSSMYLQVEFYDETTDSYTTRTMYHTDLTYTPIKYEGREMIRFEQFSLIEH